MDEISSYIASLSTVIFIMGIAIGIILTKLVDMMNVRPANKAPAESK